MREANPRSIGIYVGVFIGIVAVVLLTASLGGLVLGDTGDNSGSHTVDNDRYTDTYPDAIERSGSIEIDSVGESKTILIDQAHGNTFTRDEIDPLVTALIAAGHEVQYLDAFDPFAQSLQDADAYVVIDPQQSFMPQETEALEEFAAADGRVLLLGGPSAAGGTDLLGELIGAPAAAGSTEFDSFSSQFGFGYGAGYLYNMERNANNFQSIYVEGADSELSDGVDEVILDGPSPLVASTSAAPILQTTDDTVSSETRVEDTYTVAIQTDAVVAVGSADFITTDRFNQADNNVFISNLLSFAVAGDKEPGAPEVDDPFAPPQEPAAPPTEPDDVEIEEPIDDTPEDPEDE